MVSDNGLFFSFIKKNLFVQKYIDVLQRTGYFSCETKASFVTLFQSVYLYIYHGIMHGATIDYNKKMYNKQRYCAVHIIINVEINFLFLFVSK